MPWFLQFDVVKVTQWKDNCVYKTTVVKKIWKEANPIGHEAEIALAKEHGGDWLQATGKDYIGKNIPIIPS